jgi:ubiquinone/menaquinone biosynthesis C-methylase UbiE
MFTESAAFYDLLYGFVDYPAAVAQVEAIVERQAPEAQTLLDVGCGTGRHLELLRERYRVEGLDINPVMLETAQERLPGVELHQADMVDFSLDHRFDIIISLFSAIAYVRTEERMRTATLSMRRHLNPGGVLLIEPWFTPETYWTGTITANRVDEKDLKIAWMYTSEREGSLSVLDIHYLVGRPTGIEGFQERQELGLFSEEQHLEALRAAGLEARFEPDGLFGRGLYVAWDATS